MNERNVLYVERHPDGKRDEMVITHKDATKILQGYGIPNGYSPENIRQLAIVHPLIGEQTPPYTSVSTNDGREHYIAYHHRIWVCNLQQIPKRNPQSMVTVRFNEL